MQLGANKASIHLNFIPVFASIFAVIFLSEATWISVYRWACRRRW
ncbi:hypothetical protein [Lysinibacillus parviboronicapiens]|nr:hypothetical protein [Lysinibacillus parviboronicapiens]